MFGRATRRYCFFIAHLLRSHLTYSFVMRRFLSNAASEGGPVKKPKIEVPSLDTASSVVPGSTRAQLLFEPTLLNKEDILHARTAKLDQWVVYSGIMYKLSGPRRSYTDMIAFDMDGTLIATKSGKTFPVNEQDWKLWDPAVKTTLQRLHAENKYLAIISNQSQLKDKKNSKEAFQSKVDAVIEALGVPMDFICAIGEDRFRKPRTGMWEFLCEARGVSNSASASVGSGSTTSASSTGVSTEPVEESNSTDDEYSPKKRRHPPTTTHNIIPTVHTASALPLPRCTSSLYVGDAAGRPKEGTRGKDHSDSDYKLALNLGIQFCTPEKFFHASTARLHCQLPDPSSADVSVPLRMVDVTSPAQKLDETFFLSPERRTPNPTTTTTTTATTTASDTNNATVPAEVENEVVLLAAPPACGKSTLARRFEQGGYVRVNQDTLGSLEKCLATARQALLTKRSVCVDNTNMDSKARARWVQLARDSGVQIRAVVLSTPKEVCTLLSTYRLLDPTTVEGDRRKIERIVVNTYFKSPVYPTLSEGFSTVHTVPLDLVAPTHPQAARLFHMYLK